MKTVKPTLLILAGGLSSRYGRLKQTDKIGPSGERIIDYSIFDAIRAGFGKIVFVISEKNEKEFNKEIIDALPNEIDVEYVIQKLNSFVDNFNFHPKRVKPWGTAHALLTASKVIKEPFVSINADDFYGYQAYKLAYKFLSDKFTTDSNYALIGYKLKNTLSDNGTVSRGICEIDENNFLKSIVEGTEIQKENDKIVVKTENGKWLYLTGSEIISMNMFAFTPTIFDKHHHSFDLFIKKNSMDLKSELYIPSVIEEVLRKNDGKVKVIETSSKWFGLTYIEDKKNVSEQILELIKRKKYPSKLW